MLSGMSRDRAARSPKRRARPRLSAGSPTADRQRDHDRRAREIREELRDSRAKTIKGGSS
jgi:hypothetical protein